MTYAEKLKDQRWQKKRLELLEAAEWKCQNDCCRNEKDKPTLHVHHKLYLRKTDPWDYEDWAYQVLCDECHETEQRLMETAHSMLAKIPYLQTVLVMLEDKPAEDAEKFAEILFSIATFQPSMFKLFIPQLEAMECASRWIAFEAFMQGKEKERANPTPA